MSIPLEFDSKEFYTFFALDLSLFFSVLVSFVSRIPKFRRGALSNEMFQALTTHCRVSQCKCMHNKTWSIQAKTYLHTHSTKNPPYLLMDWNGSHVFYSLSPPFFCPSSLHIHLLILANTEQILFHVCVSCNELNSVVTLDELSFFYKFACLRVVCCDCWNEFAGFVCCFLNTETNQLNLIINYEPVEDPQQQQPSSQTQGMVSAALNDGRDGRKSWGNFTMRGVQQKNSHQPRHKNNNYFRYRGIVERIYNFHLVMWNLCDCFYTINVRVVFLVVLFTSRTWRICSHQIHRESFTDLIENIRVECEMHRNWGRIAWAREAL